MAPRLSLLLFIALVLIIVAAIFVKLQHDKKIPVVSMSQAQSEDGKEIAKAAEIIRVPLARSHAMEIAKKIETEKQRSPDKVEHIASQVIDKKVKDISQGLGADLTIITNPVKPQQIPDIKSGNEVSLNVYNIKAYPSKLLEVGIGSRGSDLAYLHRVDLPRIPLILPKGSVSYMGPFIRVEHRTGKIDGGIRLSFVF